MSRVSPSRADGADPPRAPRRPAVASVLLILWAAIATGAPCAGPEHAGPLDAYRAFARSPAATALLAEARAAMCAYFDPASVPTRPRTGHLQRPDGAATDTMPAWPGAPVGVYVTLVDGHTTRACVGSDTPLGATLSETVRALAAQALRADRRRPPVRRDELDHLRIVLAFAGSGSPVSDPMAVEPAREGLLVTSAGGSVAFLPGEARTVAYMLREARRAGVLGDVREAAFQRFQVVTVAEPAPAPAGPPARDTEP